MNNCGLADTFPAGLFVVEVEDWCDGTSVAPAHGDVVRMKG